MEITFFRRLLPVCLALASGLAACNDDDHSARLKAVKFYDDANTLRTTESYEYDEDGNAVREILVKEGASGSSERIREFYYENNRIVRMTEPNITNDFIYDTNNRLVEIKGNSIQIFFTYKGDQLATAENYFGFVYDDAGNVIRIENADTSPFNTARGQYEYDNKRYVYGFLPTELRIYFALFRSEWASLTSNVFRFNPGPNNIKRNNFFNASGQLGSYYLYNYKYGDRGLPEKLKIDIYYVDQNNNGKLNLTYTYTFEYY